MNILKATEWYTLSGQFVYWFLFKAVHVHCVVLRKSVISVYSLIPRLISLANTETCLGNFFFFLISYLPLLWSRPSITMSITWQFSEKAVCVLGKAEDSLTDESSGRKASLHYSNQLWAHSQWLYGTKFWGQNGNSLCGSNFWMIGSALVTATEVMVFMPFSAISHRDFK